MVCVAMMAQDVVNLSLYSHLYMYMPATVYRHMAASLECNNWYVTGTTGWPMSYNLFAFSLSTAWS